MADASGHSRVVSIARLLAIVGMLGMIFAYQAARGGDRNLDGTWMPGDGGVRHVVLIATPAILLAAVAFLMCAVSLIGSATRRQSLSPAISGMTMCIPAFVLFWMMWTT